MFKRIEGFLGVERLRLLAILLVVTGILSTIFSLIDAEWSIAAQTFMLLVFFMGVIWLVGGRLAGEQRAQWVLTLLPAVGLVLLGLLFLPQFIAFFVGGAVGWVVVGFLVFTRHQAPMEYRAAVKAMRKGDYETAVKTMDGLIKQEPNDPNHYRFRAELLRLWGKFPRARKDYEKMAELAQTPVARAVAYNGLAEVALQAKHLDEARANALRAYELAPDDWVTAYNLGMIYDRLNDSPAVIDALTVKLKTRLPDARHRQLVNLYLVRAYCKTGQLDHAAQALEALKQDKRALREWELLMADAGATTLREVLAQDVAAVRALLDGTLTLEALAQGRAS